MTEPIAKQTMDKEDALARGRELVQKIRALLQKRNPPSSHEQVLKYDRNQLRHPAGSGEGGRFAKGGVSAAAISMRIRQDAEAKNQASYADIMNAPTGTGFGNAPRMTGFGPEAKEALAALNAPKTSGSAFVKIASEANVADAEPLGNESNANLSLKVTLDDAAGTEAAYKPERGENWDAAFANSDITDLVTNKEFSLAEREAFAYETGDVLFGKDNPVPETVLRTDLPGVDLDDYGGGGGSGYDTSDLQDMYQEYKDKAQEKAMDEVGEEMGNLFADAKKEHLKDLRNREQEVLDIWNELAEEFPDDSEAKAGQREHPVLPMGSLAPFERKPAPAPVDPLDVLDRAGVDPSSSLSETERERVTEVLRTAMEQGAEELGDLDEDAAKDHLDYDKWLEDHADTERQLYSEKIKSFGSWRQSQGYGSGGGSGGGDKNPDAPHPNGGSLQKFVDGMRSWGTLSDEDFHRIAVLDYVIGTMDRHPSNLQFDGNGKALAIDNGYSMPGSDTPDGFTFRSNSVKSWLRGRDPKEMPAEFRNAMLARLNDRETWNALVDRHPSMSSEEREAFLGRLDSMKVAMQSPRGLYELWLNVGSLMS